MNLKDCPSVSVRRLLVESELGVKLPNIGSFTLDETTASSRNCENMIGAVQIPVGVAGPLKIRELGDFYLPLATTEGALVASISRGCKVISESGGCNIRVEYKGVTRAPVFKVGSISEGKKFETYVEDNYKKIQDVAASTSNHLTLIEAKPFALSQYIFLRLSFDTQDAMGMNMATIAATKISEHLHQALSIECLAVSGNVCVDKKPNFLNFILGRGYQVWTDVLISEDVIHSVLKTNAEAFFQTSQAKIVYGSLRAGSLGANAQHANVLAALFLATGQDPASLAECGSGITTVEKQGESLYISIFLPNLMIGTVGGGTSLATQNEALQILGLSGGDSGENAKKFASVIGAAILAGEISLLASLSAGTLASAHQKLARGINTGF